MTRTILIHLNVEVPASITTPTLTEDLADEIHAALDVGTDEDYWPFLPFLAESTVTVALAEQV